MNEKDRIAIKSDGSFLEEGVRTLLNTGIGIVAPADLVIETVKHPEMEAGRQRFLDGVGKDRQFVADSAATPAPPTTEDNPSHEADFNRLVGAASRMPKSGGQT